MEVRCGSVGDVEPIARRAALVELSRGQRRRQFGELHQRVVDLIGQKVLRGLSVPTGGYLSTLVDGSPAELDRRLPYDPAKAKTLLTEAGYPNGFSIVIDCVNVARRCARRRPTSSSRS